jgi:hypothetical protein
VSEDDDRSTEGEEPSQEELANLREEVTRLHSEVDRLEARPERRSRLRRITAGVLVVLTILTLTAAVPGAWARRTVFDTDRYLAVVGPLAEDPAVQQALARKVTDATFSALDVQDRLEAVLGTNLPRLAFLAGPVTNAVHGFIQDQVLKIVQSDAFQSLWVAANRQLHDQALAVLEGKSTAVQIQGGKVVFNYLPFVNETLKTVSGVVSQLIGRTVTLPEITPETVPSAAIPLLESALGVDLPSTFGTVVVYDSKELETVQQAVRLFDRGVILLVVLFVAFFVGALVVSQRRRRTLLQLSVAAAVVLVVERRLAIVASDNLVNGARPENRAAARAIVDQVMGSLLSYTGRLLAVALVTILIALITGPYPWAVAVRRWVAELAGTIAGTVRGAEVGAAGAWVGEHRDVLLLAGAIVAVLLFLVLDLSLLGFLVLALVTAVYMLFVWRAGAALTAVPEEARAG